MDNNKILKNEKDEEFLILNEIEFKSMKCAYAMNVKNNSQKEFFQISEGGLLSINSKKMLTNKMLVCIINYCVDRSLLC